MRLISGTKLDERIIRCDLDPGYKEGRQYGRGRSGGQVRDEYRQEFDSGRGGWGHERLREEEERKKAEAIEMQRRRAHEEVYQDQERQVGGRIVPSGAEGLYMESEGDLRAGDALQQTTSSKRQRETSEDEQEDESNKVSTRSMTVTHHSPFLHYSVAFRHFYFRILDFERSERKKMRTKMCFYDCIVIFHHMKRCHCVESGQ
jgi:hypothetical protein